jgi:hypothetical protein
MPEEKTILSGKRNIDESFIRRGRAFCWLGVYLFSPQILHVRCLSSIDRHAYSWHTTTRPLACPGSKNGVKCRSAATVYKQHYRDGNCYVLYCKALSGRQHSTSEKKGLNWNAWVSTWAFLASPPLGYKLGGLVYELHFI